MVPTMPPQRRKMPGFDELFGPPKSAIVQTEPPQTPVKSPETPRDSPEPPAAAPDLPAPGPTAPTEGEDTGDRLLHPAADWLKFSLRYPPSLRAELANTTMVVAFMTNRRTVSMQLLTVALLDLAVNDDTVRNALIERIAGMEG